MPLRGLLTAGLSVFLTATAFLLLGRSQEGERFVDEPGDGAMKAFTLRGIKDSPPYLHDGRCLTLEDVVEFFNFVQQLRLCAEEKKDLVAFLRQL